MQGSQDVACQESPVWQRMSTMAHELVAVNDRIGSLKERLSVVLTPEKPPAKVFQGEDLQKTKAPIQVEDTGQLIRDLEIRLEAIRLVQMSLDRLMERLEI